MKQNRLAKQLQKQNKYWQAKTIYPSKLDNDNVALLGKVKYVNEHTWNPETEKSENITTLHVKYGIENYFVSEGEGLELERRDDGQIVDIRVAIDKLGKAGIKEVLVNDQVKYTESLF